MERGGGCGGALVVKERRDKEAEGVRARTRPGPGLARAWRHVCVVMPKTFQTVAPSRPSGRNRACK